MALSDPIFAPLDIETISAVDTDIGIRITYIGTEQSATVLVDASGDISLKHGDLGSEAFDAEIGIPTLENIIDSSDTDSDTFGEIVDHINASSNWRAQLMGVLRADSANDTLLVFAGTPDPLQAKGIVVNCLKDTSVANTIGIKITSGILGLGVGDGSYRHGAYRLRYSSGTNTGTTLAHSTGIYSVNDVTGVETLLHPLDSSDPASAAVEVNNTDFFADVLPALAGEAILFRYVLTAAASPVIVSPSMTVYPARAVIGSRMEDPKFFASSR